MKLSSLFLFISNVQVIVWMRGAERRTAITMHALLGLHDSSPLKRFYIGGRKLKPFAF